MGIRNLLIYINTAVFVCLLLLSSAVLAQKKVDLSKQLITELPAELQNNSEVEYLDLSNAKITILPTWMGEKKHLKTLILNDVSTLTPNQVFDVLSKCENLETLIWNRGKLLYLPVKVNSIKNLKTLELSENALLKLPPFQSSANIENLNLSHNLLDSLPITFTELKKLKHFNFSYNPGATLTYNYVLLNFLPQLKSLAVNGLNTIPAGINKLKNLESLVLENGSFTSLNLDFTALNKITHLSLMGCEKLDVSAAIEQLAILSKLQSITLGHAAFEKLPYNLFKLSDLKQLNINNSCLSYIPESVSKMHLRKVSIANGKITNFNDFIEKLASIKSLKTLALNNIKTNDLNWNFGKLIQIDSLDLSNNQLKKTPLEIAAKITVNWEGNEIYIPLVANGNSLKNLKFKDDNNIYTHRKIIYAQVGDGFFLEGLFFEIPALAFVDKKGKVITDEIEFNVQFITEPTQILSTQLPLFTSNFSHLELLLGINVTCFYNKEPCYIKSDQKIGISKQIISSNQLGFFSYNSFKNTLEKLETTTIPCPSVPANDNLFPFNEQVSNSKNTYPELAFQVHASKVHISLKKNARKNTLNFDITPQYGYKESFFQLFGDRIKGYPELKTYEGIRWNYAGENMENDLQKIYFLSEQAKTEKLERNSSFYFYVLNIKDIYLSAHPSKDCYIMTIIQGADTLTIDVLPYTNITQAKKLQKWHEKKFEKYNSELKERRSYWVKLDSLYFTQFEQYESKLNEFRSKQITSFSPENSTTISFVDAPNTFTINKTGLYLLAYPLGLEKPSTLVLQFEILGHQHFPKHVLVHNRLSGKTYWQESSKVNIEEKGETYIYSMVGPHIYFGKFENNLTVKMQKLKE